MFRFIEITVRLKLQRAKSMKSFSMSNMFFPSWKIYLLYSIFIKNGPETNAAI